MKTVHTRTFLLLTLMTLPLLSHDSAAAPLPPLPTDPRAQEYVTRLHLELLAGESGYFGDVNVSTLEVTSDGRGFKVHSSIFYLLTKETPINYLHHLASDDVHILVDGGPVDYFIFHPDGTVELQTLGRDLKAGERLMVSIPGGCWKALRLRPEAPYALMANVLTPQWTADRVTISAGMGLSCWIGLNACRPERRH